MCEECEEVDALREVYLARRARMARTWSPRRPWIADMPARNGASTASPEIAEQPIAAE